MPNLLLLSGSLRAQSTNSAVLRTVLGVLPPGAHAVLYEGLNGLPHFNPDLDGDPLPVPVAELRGAIHRADALLLSTPEYAGALPGSFKNLLDWTIGDEAPGSIYGKPVAWINVSVAPTAAAAAHASLATVLGYAHALVVDAACATIPVPRRSVNDGLVTDEALVAQLAAVVTALLGAVGETERPTTGADLRSDRAVAVRMGGVPGPSAAHDLL